MMRRYLQLLDDARLLGWGKRLAGCCSVRALFSTTKRVLCGLFLLAGLSRSFAGDVVLFHGRQPHLNAEDAIQKVADFYGLTLHSVDVNSADAVNDARSLLRSPKTLALMVAQDALPALDWKEIQVVVRRPNRASIPVLVFGVAARGGSSELNLWSGGAIRICAPLADDVRPKVLKVEDAGALSRTLAGVELPAVVSPKCSMQLKPAAEGQTILAVRGDRGMNAAVLVRAQQRTSEVFFVPQMETFDRSWTGNPGGLPEAFSSMAPFILFLSYAAGDYGWHSDGHYANLTIDDAWLTQPYGHLDYAALLTEMEKHNFHTTIAFIPWNFDRSGADVVSLLRAHPERYSVCIHGNNHDHQEFGDYAVNSLPEQIADIKQGVARMERFQILTGVHYDRFMVFPHGVAPAETFGVLSRYDFLGTANSRNVPSDVDFPTDPAFLWRPLTVAYGNVLSLSRYQAASGIPRLEIAIQSFFGNPILLYGHENLFDKGIDAFDGTADLVNRVQPDTRWVSLGEISRHSHLIRRREDGGFDVLMFSNEMDLNNPTNREAVFYIQREIIPSALFSLTIDGVPADYEQTNNVLAIRVVIPAHQTKKVRVGYQNDLDLSREDIRKNNVYVYILRRVSDFRDLYLTRSSWGSALTRAYYRHGWDEVETYLERKWYLSLICFVVAVGLWYRRRRAKKRVD